MKFTKTVGIVILAGLVGFSFGFATKAQIDSRFIDGAIDLLNQASEDLETLNASHQVCSSASAMQWWADASNLTDVRERLCGKSAHNVKSSR